MSSSTSTYWEQSPRNAHLDIIAGWCFSEDGSRSPAIRVLPRGEVSVLFSAPAAGEAWESMLLGATTKASIVQQAEPRLQIQLRLAPGAAASIFATDLRPLRDEAIPLPEVWGHATESLLGGLARARSWRDRRMAIEAFLAKQRTSIASGGELVRRATQMIRREQGRIRVNTLCTRLEVPPRKLERAFAHHLGVGPKLLARIVRFRTAREALLEGEPATRVALGAGYSDQAHMTREFRTFSGVPPSLLDSRSVLSGS
jgi:AraC-like DNA-binding protein